MNTGIVKAPETLVPRGRGSNPFNAPVTEIAKKLAGTPNTWFLIGSGDRSKRSRLSNAAALLQNGKYRKLQEYYEQGDFHVRVSGAKNAPHRDEYEVGVFAQFVPKGTEAAE